MRRAIEGGRLFPLPARLLVGLSGGPDSMCLVAVLEALARRGGRGDVLGAAHFNHRLRGAASDRDALVAACAARALGLPCLIGEATEPMRGAGNTEARARQARFAFLARAAAAWRADALCLAHNRDDQAETVLLRLARGAGTPSLGAMWPRRADGVVRPLLDESRAACRAYLAARRLVPVHDATNDDPGRTRNRVRLSLLPEVERQLGVDLRPRLARLARELRIESALAAERVAALLGDAATGDRLNVETLERAGAAAGRVVHAWLTGRGLAVAERHVEAVLRLASGLRPSASLDLPGGRRILRCYGRLEIEPAGRGRGDAVAPGARPAVDLEVPGQVTFPGGWCLTSSWLPAPADGAVASPPTPGAGLAFQLAASAVSLPLRVRNPRPGDRIRLLRGRRKLSDVLIDARVPRAERAGLVVVTTADDRVLWVPGVVGCACPAGGPPDEPWIALEAVRDG